ncbi:MAG: hypothetical protein HYX69_04115 [Planctomycetia bacterium]|nr:hypothetical protein [Planctomycetia bacterium]
MTGNTPVCHGLTDQGKPCCAGTTLAIAIHVGHRFALLLRSSGTRALDAV